MTDEIPDFSKMPFEELMSTDSKKDNDKFNNALWTEQSERFVKLGIADAEKLSQVDEYQNEIDARLCKLEAKFQTLTKLIEKFGVVETPKQSLDKYLEDEVK